MRVDVTESAAKAALLNHLRSSGALKGATVISELVINNWARRADIVTVNGDVIAYEIKTSRDRLSRLSGQVSTYSEVCDRVYAVVATKHINAALSTLPAHVGVKEITAFRGRQEVQHVRDSTPSPNLSRRATLALLPAKVLSTLVRDQLGCRPANRRGELEAQAETIALAAIRTRLREYLSAKHGEATMLLREITAGRRIRARDLTDLRVSGQAAFPEKISCTSLNPDFSEWVNLLASTEAFGTVPEDIRALLQSSTQGSSVSSAPPGVS